MLRKIINYFTIILIVLFVILISLLIVNEIREISYEIRSEVLLNFYCKAPPFLVCIIFLILCVKSALAKSKAWTKWLSFSLFAIITFLTGLTFIMKVNSLRTADTLIMYILSIIGIGGMVASLLIKRYSITRWIASSLLLLLTGFTGIMSIALSAQKYTMYNDDHVLYESLENKKLKIIRQTDIYYSARERIIKDVKFPIRYSKEFKPEELNGRWKGFDELGNAITINTYKDGVVIVREPVLPENAELIRTIDSLYLAFDKPTENRYVCLEGDFFMERPLKIRGAQNITLTKPMNVVNPLINSNYNSHTALILENCTNIILDSISLNLCSNYAKEPGIISIINCKNIMIRNCFITGSAKYAIYIDKNSADIIIKNNIISGYSNNGAYLSAENTKLYDNQFTRQDNPDYLTNIRLPGTKLSQNELLQLIKTSLQASEDLPFAEAESEIKIGENWLTTFLGGPQDLYYYAGISSTLDSYFSERFGTDGSCYMTYCANIIYKLAGIPMFVQSKAFCKDKWGWYEDEPRFSHLNPDFMDWARTNLMLSPEKKVAGISLGRLYNEVFFRFFRLLTESYLYLNANYNVEEEMEAYKLASDNYNLTYHLYQRYTGILSEYNADLYNQYTENPEVYEGDYSGEGEGTNEAESEYQEYADEEHNIYEEEAQYYYNDTPYYMKQADCMGFWLRRSIDGSAGKLFEFLAEFMESYDTAWFEDLSMRYGYSRY